MAHAKRRCTQQRIELVKGEHSYTQVNSLVTHAWIAGTGPPLVVVPGLGCASWMYRQLATRLMYRRTVYLYDPPGHGLSEAGNTYPSSIYHLTDHLAKWLQVNGLEGVPLLGHSLGGEVVFDLVGRLGYPATALIACAPTGVPENPRVLLQLWRFIQDLPREHPRLILQGLRAYWHCSFLRILRLAKSQSRHVLGTALPRIQAPTLLLSGSKDPVIHPWTLEVIRQQVKEAVIREIEGGTHALTDSHSEEVAEYSLDFLKTLQA